MVEKRIDLVESVPPVKVAVGLRFGDEENCMCVDAAADNVRAVAADERRDRVSGRFLKIGTDQEIRMSPPDGS